MSPRPDPAPRGSRTDEGHPFLRGLTGIAVVALIAAGLSAMGVVLAVIISLGY